MAKDPAEAVKWYRKAAEQGHADARYKLGMVLCGGEGTAQDMAEGTYWLCKAAKQGHVQAQKKCRELNARWE